MRSFYESLSILVAQDEPTAVAVTTAQLVLTAPDPSILSVVVATAASLVATAPDPSFVTTVQPTIASLILSASDPIIPDQGLLQVTTASFVLTAPSPVIVNPTVLAVTTASFALTAPNPTVDYGYLATEALPGYPGVPLESTNEREHRRQIAGVINRMNAGRMNVTGTLTLQADSASTLWRDDRLSGDCAVIFDPMTAGAAAEKAAGYPYAEAANRTNGQWLLTHSNDPSTDRVFRVVIVG